MTDPHDDMSPQAPIPVGSLSPAALEQARALGYGLFAELLATGLTDGNSEAARIGDALGQAIDSYGSSDLLAADHHQAFLLSVVPFEGVFLGENAQVGGAGKDDLIELYRESGFDFIHCAEDPEHLSTELRCLGMLCGARSDALEDERAELLAVLDTLILRLLDGHILRWAPLFVSAVGRLNLAFPNVLAAQLLVLLSAHRLAITASEPDGEVFSLPMVPDLLEDEETGLREIAKYLATPALSGTFISRDDLRRLGRRLELPRGFADRSQLLLNLLRSASQYDKWLSLIDGLVELIVAERASFEASELPVGLTEPWLRQIETTEVLLKNLRLRSMEEFEASESEQT